MRFVLSLVLLAFLAGYLEAGKLPVKPLRFCKSLVKIFIPKTSEKNKEVRRAYSEVPYSTDGASTSSSRPPGNRLIDLVKDEYEKERENPEFFKELESIQSVEEIIDEVVENIEQEVDKHSDHESVIDEQEHVPDKEDEPELLVHDHVNEEETESVASIEPESIQSVQESVYSEEEEEEEVEQQMSDYSSVHSVPEDDTLDLDTDLQESAIYDSEPDVPDRDIDHESINSVKSRDDDDEISSEDELASYVNQKPHDEQPNQIDESDNDLNPEELEVGNFEIESEKEQVLEHLLAPTKEPELHGQLEQPELEQNQNEIQEQGAEPQEEENCVTISQERFERIITKINLQFPYMTHSSIARLVIERIENQL